MTIALTKLKVKVRSKDYRVRVRVSVRNVVGGISILNRGQFLARDIIYTSRAYATMSVSVCLSVCLSVTGSALADYS